MKQIVLSIVVSISVLFAQAHASGTVRAQTAQPEKDKTLSVEQENKDISIYPNPNNGVFTISLANPDIKRAELRIMNVIGNEIHYEVLTRTDLQFSKTIDLNKFAKGLYYVKLEGENLSVVRRVIVK